MEEQNQDYSTPKISMSSSSKLNKNNSMHLIKEEPNNNIDKERPRIFSFKNLKIFDLNQEKNQEKSKTIIFKNSNFSFNNLIGITDQEELSFRQKEAENNKSQNKLSQDEPPLINKIEGNDNTSFSKINDKTKNKLQPNLKLSLSGKSESDQSDDSSVQELDEAGHFHDILKLGPESPSDRKKFDDDFLENESGRGSEMELNNSKNELFLCFDTNIDKTKIEKGGLTPVSIRKRVLTITNASENTNNKNELNKYAIKKKDYKSEIRNNDKKLIVEYDLSKIRTVGVVDPAIFNNRNYEQEIIKKIKCLVKEFSCSFEKNDLVLLASALKQLCDFSKNYKFDYVYDLSCNWLLELNTKNTCITKIEDFGEYKQFEEIIDKMDNEIKENISYCNNKSPSVKKPININYSKSFERTKKDLRIISLRKCDESPPGPNKSKFVNNNRRNKKMKSIGEEGRTEPLNINEVMKKIKPVKIEMEIDNNFKGDEIIKELEDINKRVWGNPIVGNKKVLKQNFLNNNEEEENGYKYPFKDDSLSCIMF